MPRSSCSPSRTAPPGTSSSSARSGASGTSPVSSCSPIPARAPSYSEPSGTLPEPDPQSRIPELIPDQLTAGLLRESILEYGCLLVRGLIDRDAAERMAAGIDRAFEARERLAPGESDEDGFYDEMEPEPPHAIEGRPWVQEGGGVLAVDSPRLFFEMVEGFRAAGLETLIREYLGERPAISAQKCTLRKAMPEVGGPGTRMVASSAMSAR